MPPARILGLAMFAIGIVLLAVGYNASEAPVEQLSNTFTGHYTDKTMWYLIGGGTAVLCGGLLSAFGIRTRQ